MDIKRISDSIVVNWERDHTRCITGWMLCVDPVLNKYAGHREILRVLNDRSHEQRPLRSRIVRALLRCFQEGEIREYGELLFVAYRSMLSNYAYEVRRYMLGASREERHELIYSAFFEAAARMQTESEEGPTVLNLALKTKQIALRELARRPRMLTGGLAFEQLAKTRLTPELALRARDGLRAMEVFGPLLRDLNDDEREDAALGDGDATTLCADLRTRHPDLDEEAFNRLHQRLRQRRCRVASRIQQTGGDSLSQVRDYLALLAQEDSDAWI